MKVNLYSYKTLSIVLWLVSIHSFCVGIALIILPSETLQIFGLAPFGEKFFPVQGGVFHIVMAVAYFIAAIKVQESNQLIHFIIGAKCMATVFLLAYYLFMSPLLMLLLSGFADGMMALVIFLIYRGARKNS